MAEVTVTVRGDEYQGYALFDIVRALGSTDLYDLCRDPWSVGFPYIHEDEGRKYISLEGLYAIHSRISDRRPILAAKLEGLLDQLRDDLDDRREQRVLGHYSRRGR